MNKRIWILIILSAFAAVAVATFRTLIIGLDIDEQYAVTLAYRMARGDFLLKDMWEPHQTSVFLPALLIRFFLFFRRDLSYLLLFLRLSGVLLQAGISVLWYAVMRKEYGGKSAALTAFLLFLIVPKWIVTPEFSNQQVWFLLLIILFLFQYEKNGKRIYCVAAGIALAMEVLAYPSCVLLFIPYFVRIFRRAKRDAFLFAAVCAAGAAVFLGYLLSYLSLQDIIVYIGYVFDDPQHSAGIAEKMCAYGAEGIQILGYLLVCMMIGVGLSILVTWIAEKLFSRKVSLFRLSCFMVILTAMIDQIRLWWLEKVPTVHPQIHYLLLFLLGGILYFRASASEREKWSSLFGLAWMPSILAFAAVLMLTNLDIRGSLAHLLPGMLCSVLFWCDSAEKKEKAWFLFVLPVLWIFVLAGARTLLIRFDGGSPTNVFCVKQKALYGTAKNVYCTYMTGYEYNDDYLFLNEQVKSDDKLLYIGRHTLVYLMTDADICSASVISTPVFNERYLKYYEENSAKTPSVIAISKTYWEREEFEDVKAWIRQNYDWERREESEFLWLVRQRRQ